ncbi:MaoC/PaaZ C-terminal domain-containing protein [SAR92 clade bacterium H455]|uniref:MaoC/PaaZ C-terminal domain-containing protein n=1 Tax=SAR92 clade bacterium H455 TaxID=2974818 RepID=A0ABY5TQH6_9GAMM|nr:MaoC/PaaZ C-terminal domain-containing protein [SAR92 clade bacterium H455]
MHKRQILEVGQEFETDTITLSKGDILEFAAEFDPQPYHLETAAAEASIFGGLCASGWQVAALMSRLVSDTFRKHSVAILGIQTIPSLQWKIPVFAGDSLCATVVIADCKKDAGLLVCDIRVKNQHRKVALVLSMTLRIGSQSTAESNGSTG